VPQAPDVVLLTDFVRNTGRYVFHIRFVVDKYAADMIQAIWFEASANCLHNMSKFTKADIEVHISVAKKDGFPMAILGDVGEKLRRAWGAQIRWDQATEAERELRHRKERDHGEAGHLERLILRGEIYWCTVEE
jgi:hypothetical protein